MTKEKTLPIIHHYGIYYICYNNLFASDIIMLNINFQNCESFENKGNICHRVAFFESDKEPIVCVLSKIFKIIYIDVNQSLQWTIRNEKLIQLGFPTLHTIMENLLVSEQPHVMSRTILAPLVIPSMNPPKEDSIRTILAPSVMPSSNPPKEDLIRTILAPSVMPSSNPPKEDLIRTILAPSVTPISYIDEQNSSCGTNIKHNTSITSFGSCGSFELITTEIIDNSNEANIRNCDEMFSGDDFVIIETNVADF
jgi:hypothetical protein